MIINKILNLFSKKPSKSDFIKDIIKTTLLRSKEVGIIFDAKSDPKRYEAKYAFFAKSINKSFSGGFDDPKITIDGEIRLIDLKHGLAYIKTTIYVVIINKDAIEFNLKKRFNTVELVPNNNGRNYGCIYFDLSDLDEIGYSYLEESFIEIIFQITQEEYEALLSSFEHNKLSNQSSMIAFTVIFPKDFDGNIEEYTNKILRKEIVLDKHSFSISGFWLSSTLDLSKG